MQVGYLHDTILIVVFLRLPVRHWREHTEGIESNVRNTDCEVEYPGLILTPEPYRLSAVMSTKVFN